MCRHAAERVWSGEPPGKIAHIDLDGQFFKGWVCETCLDSLKKKGLEAYLQGRKGQRDYPPSAEIDRFLDGLELRAVCPKCLGALSR
jgi:hypothetical protein